MTGTLTLTSRSLPHFHNYSSDGGNIEEQVAAARLACFCLQSRNAASDALEAPAVEVEALG
jgi:hypothetical protein